MNFLLYIEHSAENLQFYLWHRSYTERFRGTAQPDMKLAPEWTQEQQDETFAKLHRERREGARRNSTMISSVLKGTDFVGNKSTNLGSVRYSEKHLTSLSHNDGNPSSTPPATPLHTDDLSSTASRSDASTWKCQAEDAFTAAGIQAPCKLHVQPANFVRNVPLGRGRNRSWLTESNSHHPAVPFRGRPCDCDLHHGRRATTTQPVGP